jgi:transposase InsO family protein
VRVIMLSVMPRVVIVFTDNGSCYLSRTFREACRQLGIRHLRTQPYRPAPMARPSA